jgi:TolB-like protein/Flp pilus assembly protein TadD
MSTHYHRLIEFIKELKRRKVLRVITVYAATSFVILELADILAPSLRLPDWTVNLVLLLLCVGFVVAVILSWIYDIHPEGGIVKTKPVDTAKVKTEDIPKPSNGWRIASYISFVVIVGLIVLNIVPRIKSEEVHGDQEMSIAVLPFENMSDNDYAHISSAFTDEIIMELQKIKAFERVLSRSSTMQYRENRPTIPEIAAKLNVNYLIEGAIQRHENDVYVRIQVLQANPEDHVWGHEYQGIWDDIISIQDEIAYSVASELQLVLTPGEKQNIDKLPTENMEAYNEYLLGKYFYNQHDKDSFEEGLKHFERAIQLDPEFALAYVYKAHTFQFMARYNWIKTESVYDEANEAVRKSIELDNTSGEAYAALGVFQIVFDWDFESPDEQFRKAIRLNPNSAEIQTLYAQYLRWMGRYSEGIEICKRALELDPITPVTSMWLGSMYFHAGMYDEAIAQQEKVLAMDSTFHMAYAHLAYNYTLKASYSEALYYVDKTLSFENARIDPMTSISMGWVYAKAGESEKAKEILTYWEGLSGSTPVHLVGLAMIYAALDEHEKAFDWLYKAYEERSATMIYLKSGSDNWFSDVSSDPRYTDLLEKIGFKVN